MTGQQGRTIWRAAAVLAFTTFSVGCAPSLATRQDSSPSGSPPAAQEQARARPSLDHLLPARDSIGRAPARFSWTAIEGADDYALGVWNEVDQMVWHQTHIPTNSIDRPEEIRLEPGTYFWSVSALQGDQELADSGLAAFVVRTVP